MNAIKVGFFDVLTYDSYIVEKNDGPLAKLAEHFFDFGQRRLKVAKAPDWNNDPLALQSSMKSSLQVYFSLLPAGYRKLYVEENLSQGPTLWKIALRVVLCFTVIVPLFFAYQKFQYRKQLIFVEEKFEREVILKEQEIALCKNARIEIGMLYAKLFDSIDSMNHYYEGGSISQSILNLQKHLFNYLQHAQTSNIKINQKNVESTLRELQRSLRFARQDWDADTLQWALKTSLESIKLSSVEVDEKEKSCLLLPGAFSNHITLFAIYRTKDNQYSIKIINTGEGAELIPENNGKVRDLIFNEIPQEDLLSFLRIACNSEESEKHNTEFYLDWMKKLFLKKDGSNLSYGRLHNIQKKGSCYLKCVTSWLHGRLGEDYFSFKTYMSKKSLEDAQVTIEKIEKLNFYGKWRHIFGEINEGEHVKSLERIKVAAETIIKKREQKAQRGSI